MKFFKLILLFVYYNSTGIAQVIIDGHIEEGDTIQVKYYQPFQNFANNFIETKYKENTTHNFTFSFNISQPTFVILIINNKNIELLCEPYDTIELFISSPDKNPDNWLLIKGNNAIGHSYYNNIFNKVKIDKFLGIRDVFESNYLKESELLIDKINNEINKQTSWVDSLFIKKKITQDFQVYMKTEISIALIWEVGQLCNKYFESKSNPVFRAKSYAIMNSFFNKIDPLDYKLRTCLSSSSYYSTYFRELFKTDSIVSKSEVIIPDAPYYALAPQDIQSHIWGRLLVVYSTNFPGVFDYCKLFQKYKSIYKNEAIIKHLENSNICLPVENNQSKVKILNTFDTDFFTFLHHNFHGKRLFIDLWATWCAPCKMEFKYYDDSFYDFMENHKVNLLYISIDKAEHKGRWEKEVRAIGLKGCHLIAGNSLKSSINDVIYESGTISIPRYILVDENGKIVSTDFKRPSDPLFKSEIHKFFH